jgi:hypothetical protein
MFNLIHGGIHRRMENLPVAAHNRYWAYDTFYRQNYSFILDQGNGKALPTENDSFWIDLFVEARITGALFFMNKIG